MNFKPRATIFHSSSLEKAREPHGSENQSWFFAILHGTPEGQFQNSRCAAAEKSPCPHICTAASERQLLAASKSRPLTSFFLCLNLWTYLFGKKEKEKKLALMVLFSQFSCQLTHDKRMSISINFDSIGQKNREFVGNYWKQRNHLFF